MPKINKSLKLIIMLIFIFLSSISLVQVTVYAGENETPATDEKAILEEQMNSEEVDRIKSQLDKFSGEDINNILPGYDPQKILKEVAGGSLDFNVAGILQKAAQFVFKEIYVNLHVLVKIVILTILCSVLKNLQASFLSESVGELAFYVCYIVIVSMMIVSLNTVLDFARGIVDNMVSFMHATVPVLITLLVSGGNITSAGVFQPVLIMIVEVFATIIKNVFIPLIFLSAIISTVDNISDKVQISRLAAFLKQISGWALGLILTIFIGVLTIQGSLGAVVDGVTSKTAKFAIGALIPVAGKYLADAADAVVSCTLLIKNASGVVVMVGIIVICLVPLLKIFAMLALYRIACILVEPIAEKRIVNCISEMANSITYIFGIAAAVAFMFLISVTAIIGASNISAMVR